MCIYISECLIRHDGQCDFPGIRRCTGISDVLLISAEFKLRGDAFYVTTQLHVSYQDLPVALKGEVLPPI